MTDAAVNPATVQQYPAKAVEIRSLPDGRLLQCAQRAGVVRMHGDILHGNVAMIELARRLGFALRRHPDGAWLTRVERILGALPRAA